MLSELLESLELDIPAHHSEAFSFTLKSELIHSVSKCNPPDDTTLAFS